jgi:hypothetical protein
VPVGDRAVCDPRGDIKHNDRALALDATYMVRYDNADGQRH